jgi:hypothetical protein
LINERAVSERADLASPEVARARQSGRQRKQRQVGRSSWQFPWGCGLPHADCLKICPFLVATGVQFGDEMLDGDEMISGAFKAGQQRLS